MKLIHTGRHRGQFQLIANTKLGQAALMELKPGGTSDDDVSNEHPRSEQWLYVVSGNGSAAIVSSGRRRTVKLQPGTLLIIERRELHQITNTGKKPLQTINFYLPPAYTPDGEVRPRAKR
jgi:mannose-6-phosphate isomerase-like protein (cupin superfamily)